MGPVSTFIVGSVAAAILWFAPKFFEKKQTQTEKPNEADSQSDIDYEYKD